jgi:hypothetical protein
MHLPMPRGGGRREKTTTKQHTPLKVGDRILVEEAWEDETGAYHDEYADVVGIKNGFLKLQFDRAEVASFLADAEFREEDYEPEKLNL